MSIDDLDRIEAGDEDLFEGLHRAVADATMTTSVTDVVALGRRTRNRHRALAAGIGTSAVAVVAAVGMLAPSAGSRGGSAPGAAIQGPDSGRQQPVTTGTASGGARPLRIQDAGFTLVKKADGTVELTVAEIFDPDKLQAAMDQAGIPADIQQLPAPNETDGYPSCKPTPGVTSDMSMDKEMFREMSPNGGGKLVFNAAKLPAGDVVSLMWFASSDGRHYGTFSIVTGRPQKCVVVWVPSEPRHK
ncbi:MAG: hypothetical protein ACJ786_08890 [Catenulispora sp.]